MQDILYNNEYNKNLSTRQSKQQKHNKHRQHQKQNGPFSHIEKRKKKTKQKTNKTKLFEETQIEIAFRTRHITQHSKATSTNGKIQKKRRVPNEMYGLPTEVHRIGQMGRTFYTRYKEHIPIQAIRNNNINCVRNTHTDI
jgi:hypothetical protein